MSSLNLNDKEKSFVVQEKAFKPSVHLPRTVSHVSPKSKSIAFLPELE